MNNRTLKLKTLISKYIFGEDVSEIQEMTNLWKWFAGESPNQEDTGHKLHEVLVQTLVHGRPQIGNMAQRWNQMDSCNMSFPHLVFRELLK